MNSKDLINWLLSSVQMMDINATHYPETYGTLRFKAIINFKGEVYDYNWKEPNVTYQATDRMFKAMISAFINGKWEIILISETIFTDQKDENWDAAVRKMALDLFGYGVFHCYTSTKSLRESNAAPKI